MDGNAGGSSSGRLGAAGPVVGVVATVVLFLFAVRLLGAAAEAAAPQLEWLFSRFATGVAPALGSSWLATYGLLNGSVVAAVAVSTFEAGIVGPAELFMLIAGSRLGSAAVLVLLGAVDYLQHRRGSFAGSTGMGLLAFVLTLSVYLPATALGFVGLPVAAPAVAGAVGGSGSPVAALGLVDPATDVVVRALGPVPGVAAAIAAIFASLWLLDSLLSRLETDAVRRRVFRHFGRPATALLVGFVVTALTTSVTFSLGVVVPLYNRGYVDRDEVVPYVLGANVGTLSDTLVVAGILGSAEAVAVVLSMAAAVSVVTALAVLVLPAYRDAVGGLLDWLLTDRRAYAGFVSLLVAVPVALVVLG